MCENESYLSKYYVICIAGKITATEDLDLHKTTPYEVYIQTTDERRTTGPETLTVEITGMSRCIG